MADLDRAATRREITDALITALDRRHEVLDAIVDADNRAAAVDAVAALLGVASLGAEAVVALPLHRLTKDSRRQIAAELDDLNSQLTFTLIERPDSSGEHLVLRQFSSESDRDLFEARTAEIGAAGDGSGGPAGSLDDEIGSALGRIDAEDAVWLVAEKGTQAVGMVFGELADGEVEVRVWIHPDHRHHGYGTAALRKCRSEMAAYFPAVPLVVRAPGAAG
ncbi:GNAT family N-acetyltransferase [Mycolicibacterium hippocampi]|uniref:GNAT family N-acetyltransferase n=1 Tax=Mycolicibacterium hippocampi TaxID=659824 RepID=UPI003512AAED